MITNDGGPAFPLAFQELDGSGMPITEMYAHNGMTLRDWFAGMALQGELAAQSEEFGAWPDAAIPTLASSCYAIADAMLGARGKS